VLSEVFIALLMMGVIGPRQLDNKLPTPYRSLENYPSVTYFNCT